MTSSPSETIWHGFHHIAIVTHDLDGTVRFYEKTLGMEVSHIQQLSEGRHCFIKPGRTAAWGLHVLETADIPPPDPLLFTSIPHKAVPHIAFAIRDEAAALALRQQLVAHGATVTGVNEMGPIRNILFRDNNGLLLEATWDKRTERNQR
jgi:catechol 2,3-dioxygenase-like lactoylglutathione lyase family enzyme